MSFNVPFKTYQAADLRREVSADYHDFRAIPYDRAIADDRIPRPAHALAPGAYALRFERGRREAHPITLMVFNSMLWEWSVWTPGHGSSDWNTWEAAADDVRVAFEQTGPQSWRRLD